MAWIKLPDNPHGPHALICEMIGNSVAAWLGLTTFEFGTMEVPALELPDKTTRAAGLAFVCRDVEGQPWGGGQEQIDVTVNREEIAGFVVVDTWLRNHDRYSLRGDPPPVRNVRNVYFAHHGENDALKLVAMDFTAAVRCDRAEITRSGCGIDYAKQDIVFGLFPEFREHVTEATIEPFVRRLRQFDRKEASRLVGCVPDAWGLTEAVRESVIDFLVLRADFLAEHLMSMIASEAEKQKRNELLTAMSAERTDVGETT